MTRLLSALFASAPLLAGLACTQAVRYPEGTESGHCYGNGTCNDGLSCQQNICVRSSGSGGAMSTGGTNSGNDTGGSQSTGGTMATGGSNGSGGDDATGGSQATGGTSSSGGAPASGGTTAAGGTISSGGGGTTTSGTNACNATAADNAVAFCNGQALGAMTGWGWVALGSADTLTDPTCDTAKEAITAAAACLANTNWNKPDALCMSGSVPALPGDAGAADYTSNWGVQIGVNAKDPNAGIGLAWKTITFSMSGSPSSGLRAVVHKNGEDDTKGYCFAMTPGTAVKITDFNSACWDSSGTALTEADAASIDKVGVQVSSTATAISVDNFCLTKVEFGL